MGSLKYDKAPLVYFATTEHDFLKPGACIYKVLRSKTTGGGQKYTRYRLLSTDHNGKIHSTVIPSTLIKLWLIGNKITTDRSKINIKTTFNNIVDTVYLLTGFNKKDLTEDTRKREIVKARHLIMYFCLKYTKLSSSKVGELLRPYNPFDHSTVLHGRKEIQDKLDIEEEETVEQVEYIKDKLRL